MNPTSIIFSAFCIFVGAGLGACFRWLLGMMLNALFSLLPLGTLTANLMGAFLAGLVFVFFSYKSFLPTEIMLLVIPGFLGGLTTFSTFSLEVTNLFFSGKYFWSIATIIVHVTGSLLLTALGMKLMHFFLSSTN